jgi:hypothetical protein
MAALLTKVCASSAEKAGRANVSADANVSDASNVRVFMIPSSFASIGVGAEQAAGSFVPGKAVRSGYSDRSRLPPRQDCSSRHFSTMLGLLDRSDLALDKTVIREHQRHRFFGGQSAPAGEVARLGNDAGAHPLQLIVSPLQLPLAHFRPRIAESRSSPKRLRRLTAEMAK